MRTVRQNGTLNFASPRGLSLNQLTKVRLSGPSATGTALAGRIASVEEKTYYLGVAGSIVAGTGLGAVLNGNDRLAGGLTGTAATSLAIAGAALLGRMLIAEVRFQLPNQTAVEPHFGMRESATPGVWVATLDTGSVPEMTAATSAIAAKAAIADHFRRTAIVTGVLGVGTAIAAVLRKQARAKKGKR